MSPSELKEYFAATSNPQEHEMTFQQRIRADAARSKHAAWGPTHSDDDDTDNDGMADNHDDDDASSVRQRRQELQLPPTDSPVSTKNSSRGSANTNPNQGGCSNCSNNTVPQRDRDESPLQRFFQSAQGFFSTPINCHVDMFSDVVEACTASPCHPRELSKMFGDDNAVQPLESKKDTVVPPPRLQGPTLTGTTPASGHKSSSECVATRSNSNSHSNCKHYEGRTHEDIEVSPNHHVQVRLPPTKSQTQEQQQQQQQQQNPTTPTTTKKSAPLETLTVKPDEALALERSISELTMRSSYAEMSLTKIPDNRRMAYYAVGKHHRNSGRGGNRRCYFSGKLILGGAPFYAGTVQQGLRTLVVFCLPSALGLPDKEVVHLHQQADKRHLRGSFTGNTITSVSPSRGEQLQQHVRQSSQQTSNSASVGQLPPRAETLEGRRNSSKRLHSRGTAVSGSCSIASKSYASKSRLSLSLDDLSLSIDGDLDPNWGLDHDFLLSVLPPANEALLFLMAQLYPEQFETLPVQVRDPDKWRLYVKFCFFSGLPIAEGEMHYKVLDQIAEQVYGEEIVLSHDVMEAATGASSEILTLPNRTVLRYLKKHYAQQCNKLDDKVFQRASWERVAPEI